MAELTFRWGGIGLLVGALLFGIAVVIVSLKPVTNQALSPLSSLLLLLSAICLLLSFPAMYARQAGGAGWPGILGHALLEVGILLLVLVAAPALLYPSQNLAAGENLVFFLLGIALTLGLLLTGVGTLQANVFPRWAGILLLAATAGFFFAFFVAEYLPPVTGQLGSAFFGILLALALARIGLALWSGDLGAAI